MHHVIFEIKARCADPGRIRDILRARGARFAGLDHQVDTYFRVSSGRLKLREGNVENALIFYRRENASGPKQSEVSLYNAGPGLKEILVAALGIAAVVEKEREIYFIGNVKFHIDRVHRLGSFVEIEAIGDAGSREQLRRQCEEYVQIFSIEEADLVRGSYSDMVQ